MSTVLPEGEELRRAVKWIGERRLANPDVDLQHLVDEACQKFDLNPLDGEFLFRHIHKEHGE